MKYRYVCAVDYFPNCRTHDSGYYSKLLFFKNLKEVLKAALEDIHEYELRDLYSIRTGKEITHFSLGYHYNRHSVSHLTAKIKSLKLITLDDGKGIKTWRREE